LGCGDLVDEMNIDVEHGGRIGLRHDDVSVPDLVV
jgi:hypothetical protein